MRIAFTGSHRVGKTTLAEKIADHLPGYDFRHEPYLQLEEMGYLFSAIPTLDDYFKQFDYAVEQIGNSENDVLFDRCPLDILAYIYAISKGEITQARYKEMTEAMSQIDTLVFVPIETPDLIICQELDLPNLRHEVNNLLQDWIGDLSNEIIVVTGSLESREKQILDKIGEWTK